MGTGVKLVRSFAVVGKVTASGARIVEEDGERLGLNQIGSTRPDMASCRSGRDEGDGGFIDYQMTDSGFFNWGAYMWPGVDSDTGPWFIEVFRNQKKIDSCRQDYPCHASYKPDMATPGVIFTMIGQHQGYLSKRVYAVYGQCKVPE
jgi:hypothetical protein